MVYQNFPFSVSRIILNGVKRTGHLNWSTVVVLVKDICSCK